MSDSIVRDSIASSVAAIQRVVDVPQAPFGYGSDLSCDSDLTPDMDEVDGQSTLALAQAALHRLDCPRGGVPDDKGYGIDLRAYCNHGTVADDVRRLADRIHGELTKDDRIVSLVVVVTPSSDAKTIGVKVVITPVDPNLKPFSLVLAVTSAEVLLEEIAIAT